MLIGLEIYTLMYMYGESSCLRFDIRLTAQIVVSPLKINCLGWKPVTPGQGGTDSPWLTAEDLAKIVGRYSDRAVDER